MMSNHRCALHDVESSISTSWSRIIDLHFTILNHRSPLPWCGFAREGRDIPDLYGAGHISGRYPYSLHKSRTNLLKFDLYYTDPSQNISKRPVRIYRWSTVDHALSHARFGSIDGSRSWSVPCQVRIYRRNKEPDLSHARLEVACLRRIWLG